MVTVLRLLYTRLNLKRGPGWMVRILARHLTSLQLLPVRMTDGRILYLDLRELMCIPYFLTGEIPYEKGETEFVRSVTRPADIAVDIGANIGWYSTLLSELVGPRGRVYAFEPNEKALRVLILSASIYPQLQVVPAALSDHEGEGYLHIPPQGQLVSIRDLPGSATTQKCRLTTLDRFLELEEVSSVAFVKCDVEGAELETLRGAVHLLGSERPPMWMVEMNLSSAQRFGYHPDRLVEFFRMFPQADYHGYHIQSRTGGLEPLPPSIVFDSKVLDFNAVFVPAWLEDRLKSLRDVSAQ